MRQKSLQSYDIVPKSWSSSLSAMILDFKGAEIALLGPNLALKEVTSKATMTSEVQNFNKNSWIVVLQYIALNIHGSYH